MNPPTQVNAMLSSAPRQAGPLRRPATRIPTVCVVDPKADDYQGWHDAADLGDVWLQIVPSAEEALRLSRTTRVDLWVVNADLPGLSGYELCSMLKARSPHNVVYLVANEYTPEAEQAAWRARATLFGCKPLHTQMFELWLARKHDTTIRPSRLRTRV